MIIGTQLFLTGFLAELIQTNSPNKKQYGIAEKIMGEKKQTDKK